jgi:hypothetical protein
MQRSGSQKINYLDASIRGIGNAFEKSLAKILFFKNAPSGGVLNPITTPSVARTINFPCPVYYDPEIRFRVFFQGLNYSKEENTSITDATDKNKKSVKQYNRPASYVGVDQRRTAGRHSGGHAVR